MGAKFLAVIDALRRRRRVLQLIFFIGLAALIVHVARTRPAELQISYDYGTASRGLLRAEMSYLLDGVELHRVAFDYSGRPAGVSQRHQVKLLRGDYTVRLELTYRQAVPPRFKGRALSGSAKRPIVQLTRPLLIRGDGEATVHL